MPIVGISITKQAAFRLSTQPFSNVYYYNNGIGSVPDVSGANGLIDELVTFEKSIHSSSVTFVFARCWHQTLTEIGTVMIHQKALSGAGSASPMAEFDRERAFLVRWRAGSDSRGNPVYLRKWWHCCGSFGSAMSSINTGHLGNTTGFTQGERDAITAKADQIKTLTAAGGDWHLCAKSGRAIDGNTGAHQFLEHHQLGDQWRGN